MSFDSVPCRSYSYSVGDLHQEQYSLSKRLSKKYLNCGLCSVQPCQWSDLVPESTVPC